jgi:hypothetical protein
MNDEAGPTYHAAINQMTEGAQFVLREFGPTARATAGWHVDPFGHSAATASMWSSMGMDAFGLNRIDYREKDRRKATKELEFIWRGSNSLGEETQLFAHVLDSHYGTPKEMNFDGNLRINADSRLPTFGVNLRSTADAFAKMARSRAVWYRHDQLLIPYGNDFDHQNAFKSFDDMDELIRYINTDPDHRGYNMTIKYGGLADYVKAVNDIGLTWPVLDKDHPLPNGNRDFMIYATGPTDYWSGYYSSRPKLKGYARSRDSVLRHMELMMTSANGTLKATGASANGSDLGDTYDRADTLSAITKLRRSIGVTQHHDAITGTEKQRVSDDYMTMMQASTSAAINASSKVAALLLAKQASTTTADAVDTAADSPLQYSLSEYVLARMGIVLPNCVSWRQTGGCDPKGQHEAKNDRPCDATISCGKSVTNTSGCDSGYCECAGGVLRGNFDCGRTNASQHSFTCTQLCQGVPAPASYNTTAVVIHNTLGWNVSRTIRLVVPSNELVVRDGATGLLVPSQINPLPSFAPEARNLSKTKTGNTAGPDVRFFNEMAADTGGSFHAGGTQGYQLYFRAANLLPLSMKTYFVTVEPVLARKTHATKKEIQASAADTDPVGLTIENGAYKLSFDNATGLLESILNKESGRSPITNAISGNENAPVQITQDFTQYVSADGSGAYILNPLLDNGIGDVGQCANKKPDTCCISTDPKKKQCKNMKEIPFKFVQPLITPPNGSTSPKPLLFTAPLGSGQKSLW